MPGAAGVRCREQASTDRIAFAGAESRAQPLEGAVVVPVRELVEERVVPLAALELRVVRRVVVVAELDRRAAREPERLVRAVPVDAERQPPPHGAREDRARLHHLGMGSAQDHAAVVTPGRRARRDRLQEPRALTAAGGTAEEHLERAALVVVAGRGDVAGELLRVRGLGAVDVCHETGRRAFDDVRTHARRRLDKRPLKTAHALGGFASHRSNRDASSSTPSSSSPSTRATSAAYSGERT